MSHLRIPSKGITFLHDRSDAEEIPDAAPSQILQLNLLDHLTKDILKSLRNQEQVRLKLGKKPVISYGKKSLQLDHGSDDFTSEVFSGPTDGSNPMYFTGKSTHTLEVQQAKQATAGADAALATLSNTLKSMQEERSSNEAGLVATKYSKKDHRVSPLVAKDRFLSASGTSTPFAPASLSPRLGPTSAPKLTASQSKEKIRLDAMRIPMIHLLAISPATPGELAKKLCVNQSDCDRLLEKIARDARGSPGKKELKDKPFRELDVWKFRYRSQNDRQAAIDHAVSAFDRMRIDKHDPVWQMLLAKEDRGKGINLSRLNFDKPIAVANVSSRLPERSTDGSTESKSVASEQDGQTKKAKEAATRSDVAVSKKEPNGESTPKAKPSKDVEKNHASKKGPPNKIAVKPSKQQQENAKYKSAERIEDSDEEAEEAETLPASASKAPISKGKERPSHEAGANSSPTPKSNRTTSSHPPLHKSRLSNSSDSSNDLNPAIISSHNTPKAIDKKSQKSEVSKSKASSRPRTDSSPQKPSPLGSSPPTNFTDADNSSVSSKGASQSSAPSSPPSSTESTQSKRGNKYSPVISESKPDKMANGISKRKAESSNEQPASKRQQVNGNRFNTLPQGLSDHVRNSNRTGSTESNPHSPEKQPLTKDEVIENAHRFQRYYNKYKDLHERLLAIPEKDRTDAEVDRVWTMHMRLEEMKADIWRDWDRVQ